MTKLMITLSTGLAATALLAGAASAQEFTFNYGQSQPEASSRGQAMVFFEEQLEERSDGRIEVELFFDNVLGTEQEMYDQVLTGLLQGTRGGFFANANIEFNVFLLPFLTSGWDEMMCLVTSDVAQDIQNNAHENGVHVPATAISNGFRMYTNNVRPITEVADLEGRLIREPQSDFMLLVAEALGSNATAMPFSETYQAFQQGVIDGQHNPPANIWNYNIYEVQEYLSVTRHMTGPDPLLVSLEWYETLPEDLQQIFDEVAVEASGHSDQLSRDAEDVLLAQLEEVMTTNHLSEEGITTFRDAVQPVYQASIDAGHFSAELLQEVRDTVAACAAM